MSVARAQDLLDRITNDVVFRQALENAGSKEEKQRVLDGAGFEGVTSAHVAAGLQAGLADLADAELEAVTGGTAASWLTFLKNNVNWSILLPF